MSEPKWTPGPYRIATLPAMPDDLKELAASKGMELPPPDYWRENDGSFIIMAGSEGDGQRIGSVNLIGHFKRGDQRKADDPEALANAHLFASSANLYDALAQIRAMCIPGMNWTDETGQLLLSLADAALAKARGEQ